METLYTYTMREDRKWMYVRTRDKYLNPDFVAGVDNFLTFAQSQPKWMDGPKIKCPCRKVKCQNRQFLPVNDVKGHIYKFGFVLNYDTWIWHGETETPINEEEQDQFVEGAVPNFSNYVNMVHDVVGPDFCSNDDEEQVPNPQSQKFYDMLAACRRPLWDGCTTFSQLSLVARTLVMKSEYHVTERGFDYIAQLIRDLLPKGNVAPENFYETKRLVRGLGLPVEKIHCCRNGCMLYWEENSDLSECKFCTEKRYRKLRPSERHKGTIKKKPESQMYYFPLTSRLLRLYASNATANDMRWHAEHEVVDDEMTNPSDAPAWKHFNEQFPDFAAEVRNVRLGLCTDGFQPFGQTGQTYSSWPVILTTYNLPPELCMKDSSMFLTLLVPGPKNPKDKLDVYLQPLIKELMSLWEVGILAYDIAQKMNFQMRAALMWTISDFPAYAMLSGWSTAGRLACPYCMYDSHAFTLSHSCKQSWFDHRKFLPSGHGFRSNKKSFLKNKIVREEAPPIQTGEQVLRIIDSVGMVKITELGSVKSNAVAGKNKGWRKRSIFWDLPYWKFNLIRHNLDVMHIEKNFFDNVFNTVLDIPGKTKDTLKSRQELNKYCSRLELDKDTSLGKYPKASYTLTQDDKKKLLEWVKELRFPDGYVSNLGNRVDMGNKRMYSMKSHDCHVFMQRLMPVAFRDFLPVNVWKVLSELSQFFKTLTTTVVTTKVMEKLKNEIPFILCKLERIFPPSFFNSMEHLPVHLPYEALIAGPVQYRWMYPFERYLGRLKKKVGNKAYVEGSIAQAYLLEEASMFCSYYFEAHVDTRARAIPRNYQGVQLHGSEKDSTCLSIFRNNGRPFGKAETRRLSDAEIKIVQSYILLNCEEVHPYTM